MLYEEYESYSDTIERLLKILLKEKKITFNIFKCYIGMINKEMSDNIINLNTIYRNIIKLNPKLYIKKDKDKFIITFAPQDIYEDRLLLLNYNKYIK